MKDLGYGKDYRYAHDFKDNFIEEEFLPESIKGTGLYSPGKNPRENAIKEFLQKRWKDKYDF
jgi:putative ATPase